MRKVFISILMVALLLVGATSVIAATYKSPAEIYADLKGVTVEDAYNERATTKNTFGQLAERDDLLDEYKSEMLENRKNILQDRVAKGELTPEQADAILERFKENQALCEPGSYGYGMGYGNYYGKGNGRWQNNSEAQGDNFWQGRGMKGGCFCGGRGF
ncbi:MAG: DUF2680 domain-containing protein [Desulfitobacterium sp.]|nr:DUF2680 domain-containing protein [Desulfitobacterium sp.]